MNQRTKQRTVAALQKLVADSTATPRMRRAATLRIARLRAAVTGKPTAANQPTVESLTRGLCLARETHQALALQRRALCCKKYLTPSEQKTLFALLELPEVPPANATTEQHCRFVGGISQTLQKLKSL